MEAGEGRAPGGRPCVTDTASRLQGLVLDGGQHGSSGNRISNNDTSRNVHDGLALTNSTNHNTVLGNISSDNQRVPGQGGGIILDAAAGNSVTGNVVMGNRDVGIGVFSEKTGDAMHNVLTGNVAISNRNDGMSVVDGTANGGGHFARGNTPLPNCVRISCGI